jgi:hypothetical protein
MKELLFNMLRTQLEAQRSKALLTLHLLAHHSVGIGDHSTGDYYKNADEALTMLAEANDKLETLAKYVESESLTERSLIKEQ